MKHYIVNVFDETILLADYDEKDTVKDYLKYKFKSNSYEIEGEKNVDINFIHESLGLFPTRTSSKITNLYNMQIEELAGVSEIHYIRDGELIKVFRFK